MPDPLDALRLSVVPVAPDPSFAVALRRRLLDLLSTNDALTDALEEESMTDVLNRAGLSRNGTRHGDVSYVSLAVADGAAARAFYGSVLGWHFAPGPVDAV